MLEFLLVEWTDFWSVCWFQLSLSRTWIPVNSVLFLSAVFEKLARTQTSILANSCPVLFVKLHIRSIKLAIIDWTVSSVDSDDNGDCPHIYFTGGYNEWLSVIEQKQDQKLVILIIWYGTLMLEYLLVEWTDFWSIFRFELSLSRTWIPVNSVLFLSAVFEKLAKKHTVIFTSKWLVRFTFLHVKCWNSLLWLHE